jgi:choline-glycine betaine transporter
MITEHISTILYVTGAVTALGSLQFFAPTFYSKSVLQVELKDDLTRFYFSHWGVLVLCMAILMILAGDNAALQRPVLAIVLIEKLVLVAMLLKDFKKPYTQKMRVVMAFDSICVVLFSLILLGV